MTAYRAVLVGLTGIGSARPTEEIGVPLYGPRPNSHASAYHLHPRTELVGVCDLRQEALDEFRTRWQDVWPEMRYYSNYRQMLAREGADLISIATSDHAHANIAVEATTSGVRAIFCEKPIATTLADAYRMIEAAGKHGILLSIDHTRRWDPLFVKAQQIIASGELGPLRTIVGDMFSPRAMLFRNGTHWIDMINFFAGTTPLWTVAELEDDFEGYEEYRGDGGRDPSTDPFASAYIRYGGGIRAFYNSYKIAMPGSLLSLTCEEGRIEISDRGARIIKGANHYSWNVAELLPSAHLYTRQLAAVNELVIALEQSEGAQLVSSGREARKTLEIILGMLHSHTRGNIRVDFPLG